MKKIQFGSGGENCFIDGWENTNIEQVDIRNPLPYADDSVDFIMAEHLVEHISQHDAYLFFLECRRVLKSGGVARINVPDVKKIYEATARDGYHLCRHWWPGEKQWYNPRYWEYKEKHYTKDSLESNAVVAEQMIFNWSHMSFWTVDLLVFVLTMVGFKTKIEEYGKSSVPELNGIDRHGVSIGLANAIFESSIVEATKP